MDKAEGSKYKVARTKDNLFRVMDEFYALNEKLVVARLGQHGIKEKFNPDHWDQYIEALTGHTACVFCGAPTRNQASQFQFFRQDGWICVENTSHYYMLATEQLMIKQYRCNLEAVRRHTITECEHGNLKFCCMICINARIEHNIEAAKVSNLEKEHNDN